MRYPILVEGVLGEEVGQRGNASPVAAIKRRNRRELLQCGLVHVVADLGTKLDLVKMKLVEGN
jgi:hypothetical protein